MKEYRNPEKITIIWKCAGKRVEGGENFGGAEEDVGRVEMGITAAGYALRDGHLGQKFWWV